MLAWKVTYLYISCHGKLGSASYSASINSRPAPSNANHSSVPLQILVLNPYPRPSANYVRMIRQICSQHTVLLMGSDEWYL
jgi:hypothetical protein